MRAWLLCVVFLVACSERPDPQARIPSARPDAPGERARLFVDKRLPRGATDLDPAWYRDAGRAAAALPRFSTVAGRTLDAREKTAARWQWLGPTNVAGRMRSLLLDPRDPQRLLSGGVSGGVWESRDGGGHWRPLSDDAANVNIGALAFEPGNPQVVYAGTGELFRNSSQPYAAMWGQGILRSVDDGAHFQQLLSTANDDFRYVADIVISPSQPKRLYAATNHGVWRSNDGGKTFATILRPTEGNGDPRFEGCTDLELLPGEVLMASCASRSTSDRYWLPGTLLPPACAGPCPATVFRSEDAAAEVPAWRIVLTEPGMGRTSLARAPSDASILYALAASTVPGPDRNGDGQGDYDNGLHALFQSTDGGRTWTPRLRNDAADALSTYLLSYAEGFEAARCGNGAFFAYGAGWYNQAIAVNPLNPEVVWVGGMELYRSDDGGASFGKASWWWLDGQNPAGVHADQHGIHFHPDYARGTRELYLVNDGGVARTRNDSDAVRRGPEAACGPLLDGQGVQWTTLEGGLGTTQFYTGTVNATGTRWMGGAQDNGTLLGTEPASGVFRPIFGGDGASVAMDPRSDQTLYVSYQNVNLHRSVDGGNSFTRATSGIQDQTIFIMPFVLDERSPDRLYAGGTRLWRSNNQGRTWSAASAPLGPEFFDRISAIAVSPADNNRLLVGNQRAIFRSASATTGTASTAFARTSPREGWVSSLTFDPVDAAVAYATYSTFGGAHVWRSRDAGATWTAIDGSGAGRLPDVPVHHLVVDPQHRERLYIGTDVGVFVTLDGGTSWALEVGGFANVIVERLAIAPSAAGGPQLYAFTYGRGVWRAPLGDFDAVPSYRIGADLSGTFYDPTRNGQGLLLEAINHEGVTGVLVSWYTYANGDAAWLYGTGTATGNTVRVPLSITRGGGFPPAHVASAIVNEPWGELVLRFDSADQGHAEWTTSRPGFASGGMPLTRLTRLGAGTPGFNRCRSGTWYQPSQNGHGLQWQVLDGASPQLLAVWFAYLDGRQRWLFGTGPIDGNRAQLTMTSFRGAEFSPFNPASVVREAWGTLEITTLGENNARIQWQSTQTGYGSGQLDLERLTALLGASCP